jgi:hypothetical protein
LKFKEYEEALGRFQEYRAQVQSLTRNKIKILRLDNGGEYTSKGFCDLCIEEGIKRDYIVP